MDRDRLCIRATNNNNNRGELMNILESRVSTKTVETDVGVAVRFREVDEYGHTVRHTYLVLDDEPTKKGFELHGTNFMTKGVGAFSTTLSVWNEDEKCFVANEFVKSGDTITVYPDGLEALIAISQTIAKHVDVVDGGFYVWRRNSRTPQEINIIYEINRRN